MIRITFWQGRHRLRFLFLSLLFSGVVTFSQAQVNVWTDLDPSLISRRPVDVAPQKFRAIKPDEIALRSFLGAVPNEKITRINQSQAVFFLPMPDGSSQRFRIVESPLMEQGLADRYPHIKTYSGQGIDDPTATLRFSFTEWGLEAIIISERGFIFIEPGIRGNTSQYISYYDKDLPIPASMKFCEIKTAMERAGLSPGTAPKVSGANLRTYRMAMSASGEYTALNGGTVALALAALTAVVNQVSAIYEREVAIRFVLINNNDQIVYTDATSDPFTDVNSGPCGSPIRSENQTSIDAVIGAANYDIGHVFSGTNIGGCASFAVICSGTKAWGASGVTTGGAFDVGLTAHEIGHQFSAQHTFNSNIMTCLGAQYAPTAAYEPGSGTTIMSYAGTCHDLQGFRDMFFHTKSYEEIIDFSTGGGGNSCPVTTPTGNTPPTVNAGPSGYIIPISTPFALTGSGNDADGDPLLYSWEEFDLGPTGAPNSPSGTAPIFRSFPPVASTTRTFPQMSDLLANTQTTGEILPSYGRALNFRLTARDNRANGGGVEYASMSMSVDGGSGPFLVTSPNTAVSWCPGNQTVTWDVANTNEDPINAENVNIRLSTDGGFTYPILLIANTPNDGSQVVSFPCVRSTQARVKVEAVGNVFFDISNVNFTTGDNTAPTFTVPADITLYKDANCSYDAGITVTGDVTDEDDNCDNSLDATSSDVVSVGTCDGETIITRTWTLTDDCLNSRVRVQTITIRDTTRPTFTQPSDVTIYKDENCDHDASVGVTGDVTDEADNCDNTLNATFTDVSVAGSCMGEEIITRTWSLSDDCGNTVNHDQVITVRDTTRPSIDNIDPSHTSLWPPNHTMRDVYINYDATDNCSDAAHITNVLTVTSNEPVNGTGDGDTSPDWEVIDEHHIRLRAERAGNGDGRIYTITITSTDDCGNVATATLTVIVAHNITAPISGKPFKKGTNVAFAGKFWDRPGNTHTAKWVFDDNTQTSGTVIEPSGSSNGTVNGNYIFNNPGVYKVRMNITDQTGLTSYVTSNGDLDAIVVIYDPNGGYTYGGGWFPSSTGALTSNPAATGKANFGFTANRHRTATNPRGETQFKFQVGNFEFNAVNFEYLVIAGNKAQFRGIGKITNGQSGVGFIMTVTDGELPGGDGTDRIRMKIFNRNTGFVYYDNQMGASDADNPLQAVGDNSFVVVQGTPAANQRPEIVVDESEKVNDLQVTAMPNPTNAGFAINVRSESRERIEMVVTDLFGRRLTARVIGNNATTRFGESFTPGIYILRVIQGGKVKEIKLVKL